MTRRWRLLVATAAAFLSAACGPYVQVILYAEGERATPRDRFCSVEIYERYKEPPSDLTSFGDVFVGDSGWTYMCTELSVQTRIRQEACAAGADAVHFLTTNAASGSNCRQIRASLLRREAAK